MESLWLRKELTSHSKFGQDLAAPAACQHHLSPQAVPSLSPRALYAWGGLGARASSGGHLAASRQHPSAARGNPLPPARANPSSPLPAELQRVWGAGRGRFIPKKPVAGMADPCHSAQTLFPFYLGKHETAEPRG